MLTYYFKCKRNTKNIDAKMVKTKNGRLMLSLKCAICGSKKSRFMIENKLLVVSIKKNCKKRIKKNLELNK